MAVLFNWRDWEQVLDGQENFVTEGRVWVRSNRPITVLIREVSDELQPIPSASGYTLLGTGTEVDAIVTHPVSVRCAINDAYTGTGVPDMMFFYKPVQESVLDEGEVYTNIDRMADESGTQDAVAGMMRQLALKQREMIREMQAAAAAGVPVPIFEDEAAEDHVPDPEPEPEPDDDNEPPVNP